MKPEPFIDWIRVVESEHEAARLALHRCSYATRTDPTVLRGTGIRPKDLLAAQEKLEVTYVVRMFAEFESALRHISRLMHRTNQMPRTYVSRLMDRLASACRIDDENLRLAHNVRQYRNALVHESTGGSALTLKKCRSFLCKFLARIPRPTRLKAKVGVPIA